MKQYSFAVDDNIWALADLTRHEDEYQSLFDNPYFALFRRAHERYGAKVRMHLFYQMDNPCGIAMYGGFNLSQMTAKFKDEFRENADWLHLGFHSLGEFPDKPYIGASYEQVADDYDKIAREIERFAGREAIETVTSVHWGECSREGVRALLDKGIRAIDGYMEPDTPVANYELKPDFMARLNKRGYLYNPEDGMIYSKTSAVLNTMTPDEANAHLDAALARDPERDFVEIMIHEQYFYPSYMNYLPDFEARVMNGCAWCVRHGYKPAFADEAIPR